MTWFGKSEMLKCDYTLFDIVNCQHLSFLSIFNSPGTKS